MTPIKILQYIFAVIGAAIISYGIFLIETGTAPEQEFDVRSACLEKRLTHKDLSIKPTWTGTPEKPDFSTHPPAENFRTVLTEQALEGPNFADHYTVATWGCGTNCQIASVLDAKNGAIVGYGVQANYGISFQRDSSLLITNPPRVDIPPALRGTATTSYYTIADNTLEHICSVSFEEQKEHVTPDFTWTSAQNNTLGFRIDIPEEAEMHTAELPGQEPQVRIVHYGPTQREDTELYDGFSINIERIYFDDSAFRDVVGDARAYEMRHSDAITGIATSTYGTHTGYAFSVTGLGTFTHHYIRTEPNRGFHVTTQVTDPSGLGFQTAVTRILNSLQPLTSSEAQEAQLYF